MFCLDFEQPLHDLLLQHLFQLTGLLPQLIFDLGTKGRLGLIQKDRSVLPLLSYLLCRLFRIRHFEKLFLNLARLGTARAYLARIPV